MWILLLGLTFGLVASSWASSVQEVKLRGCSYVGVFHIQGRDRYTLDFDEAQKLCEELGTTLATNENVTAAHAKGLESCRYGWVTSGNISIARHVPNPVCAGNMTGVITLAPTDLLYDAYCYNKTDLTVRNCEFEIKYVGIDPEVLGSTENAKSENTSHTAPTTVRPEDLMDSTVAVTEANHSTEKTHSTPNSSQDDHDASGLPDETTQPPTTTAEPTTKEEELTTESPEQTQEPGGVTEWHTTPITSIDITGGSGMGETMNIASTEKVTGDTESTSDYNHFFQSTETTTEDNAVIPDELLHPGGRKAIEDEHSPPEDNTNTSKGSNTDWLVILLVVVAVAAIILVAVLVVMKNRWCGRSQTLMITSKSSSEGNGTAASAASPQAQEREQEMVTLMNKEKIQENGNTEEFTAINLEESPDKNQEA